MTAEQKIDRILALLREGHTVYINTAMKSIAVKQKDVEKFAAIGHPLFLASGGSMYIAAGKRYDCIDYCTFTFA